MIPVRLALRNFMCYREDVPPLHFEGYHLICLSGNNGNGKSALIDAMTWALWGEARAKSDDELLNAGQPEMTVEFDFAVGRQIYRIIRKRSRARRPKGTGQSALDFQIDTGNGFRSLSGDSISQTQQKINGVLHLDYPTFINSAYLRQGHADEFTIKRPAERKEVLASILGLSLYDELEEHAREMTRRQEAVRNQLENTLRELAAELDRKPDYEAGARQAQEDLARREALSTAKEKELGELRRQKEDLAQKETEREQLQTRLRETANQLASWEEQAEQHASRIREYESLSAQRVAIEDGYSRFITVKALCEELDGKFRRLAGLEKQRNQMENRIRDQGQILNTEHALVQNRIAELSANAARLPDLTKKRQQLAEQLNGLADREASLGQEKESINDFQTRLNYLESEINRLEREIGEIREKRGLLANRAAAKCPLCETELGEEGLDLIRTKYAEEEQTKVSALSARRIELTPQKSELDNRRKSLAQQENTLNQEKASRQSEVRFLEKENAAATEAEARRDEEKAKLARIEQQLARREFALREQAALRELETEIAGLQYDAAQHDQARQQLLELQPHDYSQRRLEEADKNLPREREALARAEASVSRLKQNAALDQQRTKQLAEELAILPGVRQKLAEAEAESQELVRQRSQAQQMVGEARARLERCAELEKKHQEKSAQLAQTSREEGIYRELARAFGKGGIPALLIETALPEIEFEANRLLARMTDNRMHIKFETQRETRKGDVIETLDIKISDELGIRDYEMFSGGEAFRINFAIRIALSRLLARRAGAPLPTLIIDEGFGTQDSSGLEKLKEAINSIQDDFEKIIVITHIEELRDAFPTRIDVEKTAEGSTLTVN